jgi:predicted transposase YdaD
VSKPFDATTKDLIETDPAGWVAFLGCAVPASAVRLVDADLSTVTTDTDKVIRVDDPERWLLHLDIQTGPSWDMERRLLRYNALLQHRHGLAVASVVVLLRKEAQMAGLTGELAVAPPVGPAWQFRYQAVRVWERPAGEFLTGPLGLVPLAPLADFGSTELPAVVSDMRARIDTQPDRPLAAKLWAATFVLMGLRFEEQLINNVLSGVMQMEESVTYQAILRRGGELGATKEVAKLIFSFGQERFGPPTTEQESAVTAIKDLSRLESLLRRVFDVNTWGELLAGN